jgi:hypothetical protein
VVCALFAPPTTEATAAAVHGGRELPHGLKLWYCGVVWWGVERFLFDGFYLRGVLYRRNLCDVRPHRTTMGILNLNLHSCWVRWHRTLAPIAHCGQLCPIVAQSTRMREYFRGKWAAAGGTNEAVCALFAPPHHRGDRRRRARRERTPPWVEIVVLCGVVYF